MLADLDGGYGETLYHLHRASMKADLRMVRVLQHLSIADVSEDDTTPRWTSSKSGRISRCPSIVDIG
jgi:hypothetical protein